MMLVTHRLSLRPLDAGDADWIATEIANPNVQRWLTTPPHPYRHEDAVAFLATRVGNPYLRAIIMDDSPQGVVSLDHGRGNAFELGYWLKQSAWGQGIMTEAAAGLLDWHFSQGGQGVVSGWIRGNAGSERVLRKLGFTDTGAITRRAEFLDAEVDILRVRLAPGNWRKPGIPALEPVTQSS